MEGSNYPDDMKDHDNDPRSPNYDDKGEEAWCEARYTEILNDISELNDIDEIGLNDVIISNYNLKNDPEKHQLLAALIKFIEGLASDQADVEWENRDE